MASTDANTGGAKCLNHVCLPKTCHKGRLGKLGFCRMFFWRWVRSISTKTGAEVMKRAHGRPLQARWDGAGWPPVFAQPPHDGTPALERTHPFHGKMTPGILLGPRCNHDLDVGVSLLSTLVR